MKEDKTLQTGFNFNSVGIFFFVPENFEPIQGFGETKQEQVLTILSLFQRGILVEGFYKTIIFNNKNEQNK